MKKVKQINPFLGEDFCEYHPPIEKPHYGLNWWMIGAFSLGVLVQAIIVLFILWLYS